jgi:hypothetical protein
MFGDGPVTEAEVLRLDSHVQARAAAGRCQIEMPPGHSKLMDYVVFGPADA